MKKILLLTSVMLFIGTGFLRAQVSMTVIANGFNRPIGITGTGDSLFVAESGTGNHNGKVSLIITPSNLLYTIIDSLPSSTDTTTGEVSGPWRAYLMANNLLKVIVGGGPDPNAGSIMTFDLSGFVPGLPFTEANMVDFVSVQSWVLANGFVESDPFSAAWDSLGNTYIADAAANAVIKYDVNQNFSVLDTFPDIPNIFTPFPPTIQYVPTRIINNADSGFYLCNLTGFPFLDNLSSIVWLDTAGNVSTYVNGLSQLVDLVQGPTSSDLYALQFGS